MENETNYNVQGSYEYEFLLSYWCLMSVCGCMPRYKTWFCFVVWISLGMHVSFCERKAEILCSWRYFTQSFLRQKQVHVASSRSRIFPHIYSQNEKKSQLKVL